MTQQNVQPKQKAPAYADHFEHLADELKKLDLLIQLRVAAFRSQIRASQQLAASQQVYISHEEVDWLLGEDRIDHVDTESPEIVSIRRGMKLLQDNINARVAASIEHGVNLTLIQLAHTFGLSPFEVQVMMV